MEHFKQLVRDYNNTLTKYSFAANGAALTLSISTIQKTPLIQLNGSVGKFPIWCFFIGLILSWLHLILVIPSGFAHEFSTVRKEREKMKEEIESIRKEALENGIILKNIAVLTAQIQALDEEIPPEINERLNTVLGTTKDALLWLSYLMFATGVALTLISV